MKQALSKCKEENNGRIRGGNTVSEQFTLPNQMNRMFGGSGIYAASKLIRIHIK
jgi:hypothetical protein